MTADDINEELSQEEVGVPKEEDIEVLKQMLAEEKAKAENCLANWQRAQADFINYRRRTEQEREAFSQFANAELIRSLLPVVDDLERALGSIPSSYEEKDSWLDGVRLVDRKFRSILESYGVTPVKALGEPFDPNFHEAVRQDTGKEGMVISEVQKGYLLNDKLLRPSKVVVGNGEEEVVKGE